MKNIFLAFGAATVVGFSAQASLDAYAGNYSGKFEGNAGTLQIAVSGSTLSANFVGADGSSDLLGGQCGSRIGKMLKLDMDGAEVDYAVFAFNSGSCIYDVEGNELTVSFHHKNGVPTKASLSIFARMESQTNNNCWGDPNGGIHCTPQTTTIPVYAEGSFRK